MIDWIKTKDRYPTKGDLHPRAYRDKYVVYEGTFLGYTANYGKPVIVKFVMPPKKSGEYYKGYFQNWNPEEVTHWAKINLPKDVPGGG